jgi:hypothetical protein
MEEMEMMEEEVPLEGVRLRYFDDASAEDDDDRHRHRHRDGDDPFDDAADDDDDDRSEASGDTVPHNDCPPPPANATIEEINRLYWEWCYGPIVVAMRDENDDDVDDDDAPSSRAGGVDGGAGGGGGGGGRRSTMRSAPAKSW